VYSIVVRPIETASGDFRREMLWEYCALEQKWTMSSPKEHERHGVEDMGDGTFSINLVYETEYHAALEHIQKRSPFGLKVVHPPPENPNLTSFDLQMQQAMRVCGVRVAGNHTTCCGWVGGC